MINKVNSVMMSNVNFKQNYQQKQNNNKFELLNSKFDAFNALAQYNRVLINTINNTEPLTSLVAADDAMETVEGEKIYNSQGDLIAVVKENEATRTVFRPDENNSEKIGEIKVIDKKSNEPLQEEVHYSYENDDASMVEITKYSPEDGAIVQKSRYVDGELYNNTIYSNKGNQRETVSFSPVEQTRYYVGHQKDKKAISYSYNTDSQVTRIMVDRDNKVMQGHTNINFYNGAIYSIEGSGTVVIPNNLGREKLSNPELIPAEKYNNNQELKGIEGEKTYYSNKMLEKNITDDGNLIAYFDIDGSLTKVESPEKTYTFGNNFQKIVEKLPNEKVKTTVLYDSNECEVTVKDANSYQTLIYQDSKPYRYEEGIVTENEEQNSELTLYFDKNGCLNDVFDWK